jgi:AbrB family looped-hinge helix DNA binding protein
MVEIVTSKGQVTLPKTVRDLLGIVPGSRVAFERAPDGKIVLVKVEEPASESRFAKWLGSAGPGPTTDEVMAMTRGDPADDPR